MSRVSCVASACVWVEGAMWKRGWWQRLSIGPYSSGAMPHRTDNKRRGNSLPRQGLQLCVAPYFADGCRRHAGTVAVRRENATPEAVAGCHRTTQRPDTQCNICYTTADATAPHPSGVRFGGCPSAVPACRHDPTWRNTGLRTAATPRGVAEMSASGHRAMHRIAWALPACRHDPAWRNTGLRTAATACRGSGNARLWSSSPPRAEGRSLRCARFGGISRCCDAEHRTLLAPYASNGANGANGRYGGGADT